MEWRKVGKARSENVVVGISLHIVLEARFLTLKLLNTNKNQDIVWT